jgi:hypothetical protein
MKTNKLLMVIASVATLAIAGCEKPTEPANPPPATNAVPNAAKPDSSALPSAANSGASAGNAMPATPVNTNSAAGANP